MNRALLQSVLQNVGVEESTKDSSLLDAYRQRRDDAAFGQLVKRYARLVWHVCRNLTRCDADAEDAFQATFLVLARNAGKIAKPERLGSWLHGVACRVCSKARREAIRRNKRERTVANGEASNGVTDSKWDQALAAVHEELAGMPEIYRLPFVLCCLEGRGTTEAASQLGWKLGTLSGRLTRAKDLLIARLESRGIAAGSVAAAAFTVGTTNAPAVIVANAASIASGITIPSSILYLSQGVIGMSFHRIKLLAAAIMLTGGLGMGLGTTWLANAQDQPKPNVTEAGGPPNRNSLNSFLDQKAGGESKPVKKWEYYYIPQLVGPDSGIKPSDFERLLADMEPYAWEFVGEVNMRVASTAGGEPAGKGGVTLPTYVFRRPVQTPEQLLNMLIQRNEAVRAGNADKPRTPDANQPTSNQVQQDYKGSFQSAVKSLDQKNAKIAELEAQLARYTALRPGSVDKPQTSDANQPTYNQAQQDYKGSYQSALRVIDDQKKKIADLEAALFALKPKNQETIVYAQKDLPIGVSELQDILGRVALNTGRKGIQVHVTATDGGTIQLVGTKDQIEWAKRLIQSLSGKTDSPKQ